jgi:hypothetical protein
MTKFDISNCSLGAEDIKLVAKALKDNQIMSILNLSSNFAGRVSNYGSTDMSGIIGLADVIKDMRAMTNLNLASNYLRADGAKIIVEAIKVTKCTPAFILVPFSCPSDFSINCCCLLLSAGYGGTIAVHLQW